MPGGVSLAIRATPRASRNQIAGLGTDVAGRAVLLVRIASPPVDGAANTALVDLLAGALGLRKRDIVIGSGETGRNKQVVICGDPEALIARLRGLLAR